MEEVIKDNINKLYVNGEERFNDKKANVKRLPLESIKILDFTRLFPGPLCTQILADYGAEVIKIEEPNKGDYNRKFRCRSDEDYGAIFATLNRNKKSICVDLKTEDGIEIIKKIIKDVDIVVESYRPNIMKKIGLDYESVKKYNPKLIYCSITGYGQDGVYSNKAGHDINYLSYSGVLDIINRTNGNDASNMTFPPFQLSDVVGSLNSAVAILLALQNRNKYNEGQYIDVSLMDVTLSNCLQCIMPDYYRKNELPNQYESVLFGKSASYCVYETLDGRGLAVAAIEPKFWERFCIAIEREDLITFVYDNSKLFIIKDEIQNIIKTKTLKQWMEIFEDVDACVSPVLRLDELESNNHIKTRQLITKQHFCKGKIKVLEHPVKFSSIISRDKNLVAKLGENTQEVLRKYIGNS